MALSALPRFASLSRRARALLAATALCAGAFTGLVASASPAAASLPPRTTLENTIDHAVLTLINTERALHGIPRVYMNSHLQLSARRHNVRMAYWDEMSHQLPGEPWFGKRFNNAGYYWNYAGENIGWNSDISLDGVLLLERMMYNEKAPNDGHRLNILNRHYHDVGVDVYIDNTNHKIWLTTDYGHPS
jgi:uncharacterized protein YkwD